MNIKSDNNFEWLFKWFNSQCDGDWEHGNGIQIETLDNPGWTIEIDLRETELQNKTFKNLSLERTEDDWFFCKKENDLFEGNCGPFNLNEVLQIFRNWAEENKDNNVSQ